MNINLTSMFLSNSGTAMKMVKEYMSTPMLANIYIYCESYKESMPTQISKQVVINASGSRNVINDNMAIEPKVWTLKGYIKPYGYEYTTYFMPSLERQKSKLEEARDSRAALRFKDKNNKYHDVGIEKIDFDSLPDTQNALPVEMTLVELNVLNTTAGVLDQVETHATSEPGTDNGPSTSVGNQSSKSATQDNSTLKRGLDKGIDLIGGLLE
jgi:hypothetical protein